LYESLKIWSRYLQHAAPPADYASQLREESSLELLS